MGETTGATKPTRKAKSTRTTPSLQAAPVDGLETFIEAVPYGVAIRGGHHHFDGVIPCERLTAQHACVRPPLLRQWSSIGITHG